MIKIRGYEEGDSNDIINFINKLRTEIYGSPPRNISDLENIPERYHIFLLAEDNSRLIGTCGLLKTDYGGEIKRIYIEKDFRRRGIGKTLMNRILDYARKNNIPRVELFTYETNAVAVEFFSQVGSRRTKTEDGRVFFVAENLDSKIN